MTTQISDWYDLDAVRNDLNADYELVADLDSSTAGYSGLGDDWTPIGEPFGTSFEGGFDGNAHRIEDVIIQTSSAAALFGDVSGVVENLVLVADVTQLDQDQLFNAGLVGANNGTLRNIAADVSLDAPNNDSSRLAGRCGALVGDNRSVIDRCATGGVISGDYATGGLCGRNEGEIRDSYATGDVTGDFDVGGFCGDNDGTIRRSYATATTTSLRDFNEDGFCNFGTVVDCYTDQPTGKATQLSTSEMQGDSAVTSLSGFGFFPDWSRAIGGTNASADGYPVLRSVPLSIQNSFQSATVNSPFQIIDSPSATVVDTAAGKAIEVSWTERATGESGFRVYRSADASPSFPGDYDVLTETDANTETYVNDSALLEDEYTYRVTAIGDGVESDPTAAASAAIGLAVASLSTAPFNDPDLDGPSVALSWTNRVAGEYVVRAYRSATASPTFPADYEFVAEYLAGTTSADDDGVAFDSDYTYAVTGAADGVESDPDTDTATVGSPGPFAITIVGTNSPVGVGAELAVDVEITNQGDLRGDVEAAVDLTEQ